MIPLFWKLPELYTGRRNSDNDPSSRESSSPSSSSSQCPVLRSKVSLLVSGGLVRREAEIHTVSYVAGARGTLIDDGDVQIIGNDITLVARQPWPRRAGGSRETQRFEITFTEGKRLSASWWKCTERN
ncbi:hypothetical protein KUCAC02_037227 [Chaenocephalus aceratus]|nr:hypothetical protein KUCAC02_037227 [Chaenocephalus aceratus]